MKKTRTVIVVMMLAYRMFSSESLANMPSEELVHSPDGKRVVFTQESDTTLYFVCGENSEKNPMEYHPTQLWIMNVDGPNKKMLARERGTPGDQVCELHGIKNPQFSPDGDRVYYVRTGEIDRWYTLYAVSAQQYEEGFRDTFIGAVTGYEVISRGEYKGHLLVGRTSYLSPEGEMTGLRFISELWTPDGKLIKQLGDEGMKPQQHVGKGTG